MMAPTVAPKKIAGEKTPPNNPNPIHIEVRNSLNTNSKIKKAVPKEIYTFYKTEVTTHIDGSLIYLEKKNNNKRCIILYGKDKNDTNFLSEFSQRGGKSIDMAGFIKLNEKNQLVLTFGKNKGRTLEAIYEENPGYFSWVIQADFPQFTKNILKEFISSMKLKRKFEK